MHPAWAESGRAPEAYRAGSTGSVEALPGLLSARRFTPHAQF